MGTVVLIIFMFGSFSCSTPYILKQIELVDGKARNINNANVIAVYTKSRQLIDFPKKSPAKVTLDSIIGEIRDENGQKKIINIPLTEVDTMWVKKADNPRSLLKIISGLGYIWIGLLVF